MDFWDKVRKDIQKGLRESIAVVKEKAGEITDEGKKRLKILELKARVQKEVSDLGGKVYDLSSKVKNPMLDSTVKATITRIRKLESQIMRLEGKKTAIKKKTVKSKGKA
jgi:hypothetical protein